MISKVVPTALLQWRQFMALPDGSWVTALHSLLLGVVAKKRGGGGSGDGGVGHVRRLYALAVMCILIFLTDAPCFVQGTAAHSTYRYNRVKKRILCK